MTKQRTYADGKLITFASFKKDEKQLYKYGILDEYDKDKITGLANGACYSEYTSEIKLDNVKYGQNIHMTFEDYDYVDKNGYRKCGKSMVDIRVI